MRIRKREFAFAHDGYLGSQYWTNAPDYKVNFTTDVNAVKQLQEECQDELHPGPPYRSGGPFDKMSFYTEQCTPKALVHMVGTTRTRHTYHVPSAYLKDFLQPPSDDWGDVSDQGASGWNRYRPTRPRTDLGVGLAELRDFPRMLLTSAKDFKALFLNAPKRASQAGDSWLNAQFGWLPFISDVRKTVRLTKTLDERYNQLIKDNGKWIKRGGPLNSTSSSETVLDEPVWGLYPGPYDEFVSGEGSGRRLATVTDSQESWFAARFRYYIPTSNKFYMSAKAYAMLFGCVPSPSLLWELVPFSWMVDWCCNFGDNIEMLSSTIMENLCAKYAYVMGTTRRSVDYRGEADYDLKGLRIGANWTAYYERKVRYPASQFGFDLTKDSFSLRQWSILGALGLSRLS